MASKVLTWGVNAYPDRANVLQGCLNDVANLAVRARRLANFDAAANLRVILDADCTTANIKDAMAWLVDGVGPGEFALLHHSDHGATTVNDDGTIEDLICPVDFDWTPEHWISADDAIAILSALNPAARLFWLPDCCHSGNLDEQGQAIRPTVFAYKGHARCFETPWEVQQAVYAAKAGRAEHRGLGNTGDGQPLRVALLSACRSDQTACDAFINGQHCGAFTTYFLQALAAAPTPVDLADLGSATVGLLASNGYDQMPVASGCWTGEPFPR